MSFLTPLFLLGGLAIGLPILFHLIRRTTRERTDFSTLMFLQPTPPRVTRRSRIENWLLLLLRCGVILLLAFGFARPFLPNLLPETPSTEMGRDIAIVIDTSASMRRDGLWDQAVRKASDIASASKTPDRISMHAFDRDSRTLLTEEEWAGAASGERVTLLKQRLANVEPGWHATQLGEALLRAAEQFTARDNSEGRLREIVLISDLQDGAHLEGLQGYEWAKNLNVRIVSVSSKTPGNAGMQWVAAATPTDEGASPRIRVVSAQDSPRDQFRLRWTGAPDSEAQSIYIPAGQSRAVTPPAPVGSADRTQLLLEGDGAAFDNTLHVLPPQTTVLPVLFAGTDAPGDSSKSLFYLSRAFQQRQSERIELKPMVAGASVPEWELKAAQLMILGDAPDDAQIAAARRFAAGGKIVLMAMAAAGDSAVLGKLLETAAPPATEARVKDFALLGDIDLQHPLFRPFDDPRYSDFTKVHFWKHRRVDVSGVANARVIAKFDSGDPALIEVPVGKGSVLTWTSTWRPSDGQLALSSKFVPMLFTLLELSSDLPPRKAQYFVGDSVPMPVSSEALSVILPDGSKADVAAGETFNRTAAPGVYQVTPGTMKFVVNLAPEESRTHPLEESALAALGVPLSIGGKSAAPRTPADPQRAAASESEGRQKLWRWLVVGALFFALVESWLAARTLRRPVAEPVGA